jgi:hypothetical protein
MAAPWLRAFGERPVAPGLTRDAALVILILALAIGSGLRFYRLGAEEMSRGEAAAWTAAAAPDIASVYRASRQLDPGKSGIYDLVLHLWIVSFGDRVGAMRALSAVLGTLVIVLVFAAVREILSGFDPDPDIGFTALAGAFAALLYACNFQMITIDRTARMYPLMMVAVLGQLWCFARVHRRAEVWPLAGAVIASCVAVASNFTSMFFFMAEAFWLSWLWWSIGRTRTAARLSVWRPAASLIIAAAIFLPIGVADAHNAIHVLHAGVLGSIEPHPPWWPLRALQVMTGNAAFWPILLIAIYGAWRARERDRLAITFVLCWVAIPFAILELVSYAMTPLMVERYVLPSLVAWLVLAGIGLALVAGGIPRYAIAAIVVAQSIAHIHHHWRAPGDVQWREAAQFAISAAPFGQKIVVMPPAEPLLVLRYYLPPADRARLVGADARLDQSRQWQMKCGPEPILIASSELPRDFRPQLEACYPRLVRQLRLVEVRGQ